MITLGCWGKWCRHSDGHQHAAHSHGPKRQLRWATILIRGWRTLKKASEAATFLAEVLLPGTPLQGLGHHSVKKDLMGGIQKETTDRLSVRSFEFKSRKHIYKKSFLKLGRNQGQALRGGKDSWRVSCVHSAHRRHGGPWHRNSHWFLRITIREVRKPRQII